MWFAVWSLAGREHVPPRRRIEATDPHLTLPHTKRGGLQSQEQRESQFVFNLSESMVDTFEISLFQQTIPDSGFEH